MQLIAPIGNSYDSMRKHYLDYALKIIEGRASPRLRTSSVLAAVASVENADNGLDSEGSTGADGADNGGSGGDDDDGDGDGDPDRRRSSHPLESHTCSTRHSAASFPHSRSNSSGASSTSLPDTPTPLSRQPHSASRSRRRDWMSFAFVFCTLAVGLHLAHAGHTLPALVVLGGGVRQALKAFTDA